MNRTTLASLSLLAAALVPIPAPAGVDDVAAAYEEDGKSFTADDVPTFNVAEDGTVDWYTFSGFRRFNAECSVCHGPDGQGSSFAPALKDSVYQIDYYAFVDTVVNGRQNGNRVMPSFGDNQNVMCYLDDIYIYLRAMGAEAIPRGRPAKRADKPEAFTEAENACMG
jgi:methanol metabolism-related c-type cytochrome